MNAPMNSNACEILSWDSDFFAKKIARVTRGEMTSAELQLTVEWCRRAGVRCLYWLVPGANAEEFRLAARFGFQLVDLRMELVAAVAGTGALVSAPAFVRRARGDDLPSLRDLARRAHVDSRFHRDLGFGEEKAGELFTRWIERDYGNEAGVVWVLEGACGRPAGYASCQMECTESGTCVGRIGLFAVDETARGKGGGAALLERCMEWFGAGGAISVRVVTQGVNVPAQRLYQKGGFRTISADGWHHLWFDA